MIKDFSMDWRLVLRDLEAQPTAEEVFKMLRALPLDLVGATLLNIHAEYEGPLKGKLPFMASEEIQKNWTGASGYHLLSQTTAFVRSIESAYLRLTGKSLEGASILDYGCGWGRILRLMYKHSAPTDLYGCDPWDQSIKICQDDGVAANLAVSDYLPRALPFNGVKFDLIYSFSVFTHLSERAARMAMEACRQSIAENGVMAITIRPLAYWDAHQESQGVVDRDRMKRDHEARGFAFTPHNRMAIEGEVTYGDTSISLGYIDRNWQGWEVVDQDWQLHDPYQTVVFLKPV